MGLWDKFLERLRKPIGTIILQQYLDEYWAEKNKQWEEANKDMPSGIALSILREAQSSHAVSDIVIWKFRQPNMKFNDN